MCPNYHAQSGALTVLLFTNGARAEAGGGKCQIKLPDCNGLDRDNYRLEMPI